MSEPPILDEAAVRSRLDCDALIPSMERALAAFSRGDVEQPVRTVLDVSGRGVFAVMPAHVRGDELLGAKLVSVFPGNAGRGKPTHQATIVLIDPETGETLAVMDGRYITEVRTAAVSAVSVRHLARADARKLGIIGSGVQGRSHVEMLRRVREWSSILAWSPDRERLRRFAEECGATPASSAEEVARGSDVLVTATSAREPFLRSEWVRDGAHVIAVGACLPGQSEVGPALVARSRLFVDSEAAAMRESGDVLGGIRAGGAIAGELGQVIGGAIRGREFPGQVTLFKSLGLAVEDIVAAGLVYAAVRK